MADENILNKIRALRAKATNHASTEAEVAAAAAAITKLMMKYDIEESDVTEKDSTAKAVHARTDVHKNSTDLILEKCWFGIQSLTETKLYNTRAPGGKIYNYVGAEPDVEMALYLHEMVVMSGRRAWYAYRADLSEQGLTKSRYAREDFYTAFGSRLCARLMELADERKSVRSGSTALVVAKGALIKDKMREMGVTLRTSRAKGHECSDASAVHAARSAADRVNLNRPFAGNGNRERIA